MKLPCSILVALAPALMPVAGAAALLGDRLEELHGALLDNRREALPGLSDPFGTPDRARLVVEESPHSLRMFRGWRGNVVGTVFWIGELPSQNNPVPNTASAWDMNWQANFGGYDHPERRAGYYPAAFTPRLNPFYIALPYNDIGKDGQHRPEASEVIPWFWRDYRGEGISVCKGRCGSRGNRGRRISCALTKDLSDWQSDNCCSRTRP